MPLPRTAPGTLKWWVIGSIGIGLGVALAIWFGLSATLGQPSWQTMGYRVVDNESVWVDFEVHSPGGKDLVCTVHALAGDFAVVGSTDVPVDLAGVFFFFAISFSLPNAECRMPNGIAEKMAAFHLALGIWQSAISFTQCDSPQTFGREYRVTRSRCG